MLPLEKLLAMQEKNRTVICLGLDLDPRRMPADYGKTTKGMFEFAHRIIDATVDLVCAYKPNLAFFERLGAEGISLLKLLRERIPPEIPVIMDAKRGDIGNTASHYAHFLFDVLDGDWVTLSPYLGYDALRPFLERKDKGSFILCLTSNPGSKDFQTLNVDGRPLYLVVADKVNYWNKEQNCGLVVGATHPDELATVRKVAPSLPLLIPGVGAQGGTLEEVLPTGTVDFTQPVVVNVSRSVLYASSEKDFAQRARVELSRLANIYREMRGDMSSDEDHTTNESKVVVGESVAEAPENEPADPDESTPPSESP